MADLFTKVDETGDSYEMSMTFLPETLKYPAAETLEKIKSEAINHVFMFGGDDLKSDYVDSPIIVSIVNCRLDCFTVSLHSPNGRNF